MEVTRKPFQGIINIIRFNWHFYVVAIIVSISLLLLKTLLPQWLQSLAVVITLLAIITIVISLLVSVYVYDVSNLYQLSWLHNNAGNNILNINAGFDETSAIIQTKYPKANIIVCDFYNPDKHTEISIKRARRAYPPSLQTITVTSHKLPFAENTFDQSVAILSAHEIRNDVERIQFFKELSRVTKGQIFVTEHLRDVNNFLAYSIGFFHFHTRKTWLQTFKQANLTVIQTVKTTPFITTFILDKNGNTF